MLPWLPSQQQPALAAVLGRKILTIPIKPPKTSENIPTPHQDQPKNSRNFYEKPKTFPNGLPWQETSWGVGRRTKVFSSAGTGGTWLEVSQTPAEL